MGQTETLSVNQGGASVLPCLLELLLPRGLCEELRALPTALGTPGCCWSWERMHWRSIYDISSAVNRELHSESCGEDRMLVKSHMLLNGCEKQV